MLYWICPECGHECSPAIRECPSCAAAGDAAPSEPTSAGVLSLAQNLEPAPAVGLLSTASYRNLVSSANGHSAPVNAAVLIADPSEHAATDSDQAPDPRIDSLVKPLVESAKIESAKIESAKLEPAKLEPAKTVEPEASSKLAPLDNVALKPSCPALPEMEKPAVSPVAPRLPAPSLVAARSPKTTFALKAADLAPTGKISFQAVPGLVPKAHEREVEPAPSRRRSVAFVRATPPGADSSEFGIAGFVQPGEARLTPAVPSHELAQGGDGISPAAVQPKAESLAYISSTLELTGESLSEMLHAFETSAEELERVALRAIQKAFHQQPTALLLNEPREIVTAPAPPAEQWLRSPKLVFVPHAPENTGSATITAGPQTPTLAGPCLPPQLRNFTGNQNSNHGPARRRSGAPTWMVSVLVATALFLGAGTLLQYLSANRDAKAASAAPVQSQTSDSAPAPAPVPVVEEHPGARFVEVAGVRIVTAPNKKPQLQYIAINHSSGELTGLKIRITIHSADSPSGTPLFSVSSVVPSLPANQSKEVHADLDAGIKAASIPDWQSLRPEILITRQ